MGIIPILKGVSKAVSIGSNAAKVGKFIVDNSEEKRKQRELQKQEMEIRKQIEALRSRSLLVTVMIYVLTTVFCAWLLSIGTVGVVLVILGFVGHLYNLSEMSKRASVKRESVLTGIEIVCLLLLFLA